MCISRMKALSIAQPWAECIISRGKNVENRNWNTKYRGYFAVHASAGLDLDRFSTCLEDYRVRLDPDDLPYGAIVGIAELVSVITEDELTRKTKRWFCGDYGFVLGEVIRHREPVPAKGSLSFWTLKGKALSKVLNQLNQTQLKRVQRLLLTRME